MLNRPIKTQCDLIHKALLESSLIVKIELIIPKIETHIFSLNLRSIEVYEAYQRVVEIICLFDLEEFCWSWNWGSFYWFVQSNPIIMSCLIENSKGFDSRSGLRELIKFSNLLKIVCSCLTQLIPANSYASNSLTFANFSCVTLEDL